MKRNTIQRTLILESIKKLKSHPTADELYTEISSAHPTISRGTVYRNLNQLAENGDIRRVEIPGNADHFDHCCEDHYHVRCLRCGKIFDVEMDYIPDLEKSIQNTNGFQLSGYDLIFKGICPDCSSVSRNHALADADFPPPITKGE